MSFLRSAFSHKYLGGIALAALLAAVSMLVTVLLPEWVLLVSMLSFVIWAWVGTFHSEVPGYRKVSHLAHEACERFDEMVILFIVVVFIAGMSTAVKQNFSALYGAVLLLFCVMTALLLIDSKKDYDV